MDEVLREVLMQQDLEIPLLPLTFNEMARNTSLSEEEFVLEKRLIYGSYPEIVTDLEFAEPKLREIVQEAIFTNLGVTDRINKGDKLMRMLQALSFRIGEAVSYNEIAEKSGLDNETVERYIELLEKSFILIKLPVYYHGHRYEMKKSHVVYFLDNGIRNVLINNFNPLFLRNDVDQLWKNWLIAERIKWVRMAGRQTEFYFWRTHTRQSIDLIEVHSNVANAYKTAWDKKKKIKFPAAFKEAYPQIATHTLNKSTYLGFLTKK
jgi:predicted AAA+ superfamily ATPase